MESQTQRRLVVVEGPMEGRSFPLKDRVTTMGRASDNAIVFDSSRISRRHVQIRLLPQGAVIEDLGSTNGTWINNERLIDAQTLTSGDVIRLADYVTLRYVQEGMELSPHRERTAAMGESSEYESVPEPVYAVAYDDEQQPSDAYEPVSPAQLSASTTDAVSIEETSPRRPSRALYVIVGALVLLICLCVATAVYLWFAPVEFWERVFDALGIPMPTAYLYGLWTVLRL